MWQRIKNFALYGDTDRESYQAIREQMEAYNRVTALVFASVATVLISVMLCLSFFQDGFSGSKPVYIVGILLSLAQVAVALGSRKRPVLTYASVYMAVSVFLIYGIAIATLTRPEEQTVTFMVLLIFVPLIFVDRPLRMAGSLVFYIIVFIIMAYRTKTGSVLAVDVTDAVIFGLLSLVSETVVYRAKIRGYVLEYRLHMMGETDQLTGVNNRNCYERMIAEYPHLYLHSICCIYIDVNGLHELNNTQGHKAGDEMLRYIADVIRDIFGKRDTYRIGGDEYVAFVVDESLGDIENKIAGMNARIRDRGYHAAVGYEYAEGRDADLNRLIAQAETDMYRDKAEYYKSHDRRVR